MNPYCKDERGTSHLPWRRCSLAVVTIALVVIVGLLALFASTETVGAQEVDTDEDAVDPADVTRVHLQVNPGDTCSELAETYTGSGLRCRELVDANPGRLHWKNGEDVGLRAGKFYWLPTSWITHFLESESAHRTHYFERYYVPSTSTDPGETTKLPVIGVANLEPHNCNVWWPVDPHCEGGDKTLGVLLAVIAVIVGGGIMFTAYRRRKDSRWPFS